MNLVHYQRTLKFPFQFCFVLMLDHDYDDDDQQPVLFTIILDNILAIIFTIKEDDVVYLIWPKNMVENMTLLKFHVYPINCLNACANINACKSETLSNNILFYLKCCKFIFIIDNYNQFQKEMKTKKYLIFIIKTKLQ
ncbi:hypothetical protein DERP_002081 [Dermatophagoides pteronyssinus]|uniref:Uncharacterized protein n=1 Tax=Dermatophagoides pteronyssinus TaxID=6956 RepID=A0ABQ8JGR7_DERPT|nr:hypothetical protein DERP_002081 [Dermatophagoides pteronyssinus]